MLQTQQQKTDLTSTMCERLVETSIGAKTAEDINNLLTQDGVGPGVIGTLPQAVAQLAENAFDGTMLWCVRWARDNPKDIV